MKKVLVTGAAGFIGRQTLPLLLARGYEVHGVILPGAISPSPLRGEGGGEGDILWHHGNLFSPADRDRLLENIRPTHLLHLAWCTTPGVYRNSPENLDWLCASVKLARKFADCGGRRAVFAGTCFEYDVSYGCCSEMKTPCRPDTLYGTCKNALRQVVSDFLPRENVSAAWGRVFYLFGPHEYPQRLVPSVIISLLRGEPALCTPGDQLRDFLYVGDVADAFVALLESGVEGPVNIGSGIPVAVKDIIGRIGGMLNERDLIRLGEIAAAPGEPPLVCADTGRLQNEVGWQPSYSLEQGLELTIDWWKNVCHSRG